MTALNSIPTAPKALPLLGHLVQLLRDPLEFLTSLPAHGDLVRIRLGPLKMVVVCDPEFTHQVLRNDRIFDKGGPLFERIKETLGNGLISCPHDTHRRQRRLAQPAFHPTRLPGYAQTMTTRIATVIDSWRNGQVLDVLTEMMTITSQITTATMFSDMLPAPALSRLTEDVNTVVDGWYWRMLLFPPLDRLPTPGNRSYQHAHSRLFHTLNTLVAQRRTCGGDHGDLLSALMTARDPESNGHGMTDTEITDTLVTFFAAGTETSASTLAWALHLLSQHPQIEQRLHAEVDSVLGDRPATHADLPKLEMTGRVITETLRLFGPGWFITRTVTAAIRLGEYSLPTGTNVAYSPYLIHRREDLYHNPASFDPDRWDPVNHPKPARHALIPFGGGARKCIADTFAITEATLALATITARWHLEPLHKVRPSLTSTTLRPRELRMRATSRTTTRPNGPDSPSSVVTPTTVDHSHPTET